MEQTDNNQRGEGDGDDGGKKGKGLVKEQAWMTHRHGQQGGDWLWKQRGGLGGGGHGGDMGTNVIE